MSRPGSSAFSMRQITCAFAPSARNGGLALDARAASSNISAPCANIRRQRAHQGSLSTGHSGMGKTMLVEKLRRDHPPAFNSAVGFETFPVLAISLTSRPTERRVYAQLLMALGVSVNERATLLELEIKAIRLLKDSMVRVLVFDEVHNLLAGSPREQRVILQLFRHLSNELKASLVCLGVADARDAIAGDVQLARRLDQLVLPRWKGDEEFQEMVTAICAACLSNAPPSCPRKASVISCE